MFNSGKGRLYAAADKQLDYLNLEGKDVKVYGAFQNAATNSNGKPADTITPLISGSNLHKIGDNIQNLGDGAKNMIKFGINTIHS